ncbi:MAG: hypothetical protein D6734_07630 [Candidatus Schekmanbacteria bacterium]|nr:MAG: hypothetical protein D6734_07630 [Candidatus Schekmanbacteria bacterium]
MSSKSSSKSSRTRQGYLFEKEIERSLGLWGWRYWFKIPDARTMKGFKLPSAPQVPADFCGIDENKKFCLLECKQVSKPSLPYDRVKEHQVENLFLANNSGGIGYLCVNFNNRLRGHRRIDRTFLLNSRRWDEYKLSHPERKSMPIAAFELLGEELYLIRRGGKRYWLRRFKNGKQT